MVTAFALVASKKLCNFDLDTDIKSCLFNVSLDIHKHPSHQSGAYSCGCSNPDCTCLKSRRFKKLVTLKQNGQTNGWNPGGQGEGFGEPVRSSMGGQYRYSIGRENVPEQQDPKSWQKYLSQYQGQQGQDDWQKYMSQDQGQQGQRQAQALLFNFSVTGNNIQIESSFGLGGGRGDLEISGGSGGGGQHKILIEKGTVQFLGAGNL